MTQLLTLSLYSFEYFWKKIKGGGDYLSPSAALSMGVLKSSFHYLGLMGLCSLTLFIKRSHLGDQRVYLSKLLPLPLSMLMQNFKVLPFFCFYVYVQYFTHLSFYLNNLCIGTVRVKILTIIFIKLILELT